MKKRAIRLLSLVLVALMALTCMFVAGMSASAATSSAGDVVYFDNSVTNFSTVYCYIWSDNNGANGTWPGEAMTKMSGDIWAYNIKSNYDKLIFNGGMGAIQSCNIDYQGNNQIAKPNSSESNFNVSWESYSGDETISTISTSDVTPTTTSNGNSKGSAGTVYCQNDAGWSTVYCYMWNSDSDKNAEWPGVAMTDLGEGVWEYNYPKQYANVIFNANRSPQTNNLVLPGDGQIYNNKTGAWETYNPSPVKITALDTSVKSPCYTTCSITITATAKSNEGTLSYKFKIKDSAGLESVISDGASPSVTWIPTAPDTYTISVDVTDSAGNTNTRSINFVVNDANLLETAFIRAFSNSLGTRTQIKKDSSITFTMDAIGGHTGNNTLFYKFQITDPDSNGNVAYYTTSNTYTYTPTKLGTYSIKTSVQNSYNNVVSNTYNYACVDTINEDEYSTNPPPVTTPTSPKPSTSPTPVPTSASTGSSTSVSSTSVVKPLGLGDVNSDGAIDIKDVTALQKHIASIITIDTTYADANKDGIINIKDATTIQKYIAGIIVEF